MACQLLATVGPQASIAQFKRKTPDIRRVALLFSCLEGMKGDRRVITGASIDEGELRSYLVLSAPSPSELVWPKSHDRLMMDEFCTTGWKRIDNRDRQ